MSTFKKTKAEIDDAVKLMAETLTVLSKNEPMAPAYGVPVYSMLILIAAGVREIMEFIDEFRGQEEAGGIGPVERKEQSVSS